MDCRQSQKKILAHLLQGDSYPTAIAIHGPSGSGKTSTVSQFLKSSTCSASWVQCDQCLTARVLLQRALRRIFEVTETGTADDAICENVEVFLSLLKDKFLSKSFTKQHVLILDRIDRLPDYRAMSDLFVCLSRIPELTDGLCNVVVLFIYSTADSRALVTNPAVPRIWFPRFTKDEVLKILTESVDMLPTIGSERSEHFKREFMELVVNALGPNAGSDVALLKRIACRIWKEFLVGADSEDSVAKIYLKKANLFQADQLIDKLEVADSSASALQVTPLSCYLLCAAYLASYNSPRYDMRYFSQAKNMRNKRRETRPKKSVTIPGRSLAPPAFEMERLLAIYHAINPSSFDFYPTVAVNKEIASLEAQKLIVKSSTDPLDSRTKWKINVPWSYVQRVADEVGFNIEDYLVES